MKALLQLIGGTAATQLIALSMAPVLTRLYTPSDFGHLAVFTALLSLCGVVAGLRYEQAIVLVATRAEATNLLVLIAAISAGLALATALILAVLLGWDAAFGQGDGISIYLSLLPIGILGAGLYSGLANLVLRSKDYWLVARSRVLQSTAAVLAQLGGAKLLPGAWGLIVGAVTTTLLGAILLGRSTLPDLAPLLRRVTRRRMIAVAKRHYRFPVYSSLNGFVSAAGAQLPVLILAAYFSSAELGFFGLAMRIGQGPLTLLGQAVGQLHLSQVGERVREKRIATHTSEYSQALLQTSVPPALIVGFFVPAIVGTIFGAEWEAAGRVLQLLLPWTVAQFVVSPMATTVGALGKQRGGLILHSSFLVVRTTVAAVGASLLNFEQAVLLLSSVSCACYVIFALWVHHISGAGFGRLALGLCRNMLLGILVGGPLVAMSFVDGVAILPRLAPWLSIAIASPFVLRLFRSRALHADG